LLRLFGLLLLCLWRSECFLHNCSWSADDGEGDG
jgi:hypothetical protein